MIVIRVEVIVSETCACLTETFHYSSHAFNECITVCGYMRYYFDTCIWRDYFEDRSDGKKPLGELALAFLQEIVMNGDRIVISDMVREELSVAFNED